MAIPHRLLAGFVPINPGGAQGDADELGLFELVVGLMCCLKNRLIQGVRLGMLEFVGMLQAVEYPLVFKKVCGLDVAFEKGSAGRIFNECTVVFQGMRVKNYTKGVGI